MSDERRTYTMTDEQLATLLDAARPVPVMFLSGGMPMYPSPQESANRAWAKLGEEMGFQSTTVRPVPGADQRVFTAVPREDDRQ